MTIPQNLFNQSSLAEATYADFSNNKNGDGSYNIVNALTKLDPPFTNIQAAEFAAKYRVVSHICHIPTDWLMLNGSAD